MKKAPVSRRLLDIAIDQLATSKSLDPVRLRRFIGNVIVAQLLPAGVVKGGSSLKLRFGNMATPWMTVPLEIGHNEIGDADEPEAALSEDVPPLFEALGLPIPTEVYLMPLHFQVAQKLHAVSSPNNNRARDLVDLQLIVNNGDLDIKKTAATCRRLFAYRQKQHWPPTIVKGKDWDDLYLSAKEDLAVLPSADESITWANTLIRKIAAES